MLNPEQREYHRERYAQRREAGLCKNHDKPIDRSRSKSRCAACLDSLKSTNKALTNAKRCLSCRRKHKSNLTLCDRCRSNVLKNRQSRRRLLSFERHLEGLCVKCGAVKINQSLKLCGGCRAAQRNAANPTTPDTASP